MQVNGLGNNTNLRLRRTRLHGTSVCKCQSFAVSITSAGRPPAALFYMPENRERIKQPQSLVCVPCVSTMSTVRTRLQSTGHMLVNCTSPLKMRLTSIWLPRCLLSLTVSPTKSMWCSNPIPTWLTTVISLRMKISLPLLRYLFPPIGGLYSQWSFGLRERDLQGSHH